MSGLWQSMTTAWMSRTDRSALLDFWLGGRGAGTLVSQPDIDEHEMRRIRAAQINSVTRLTPVTMSINVANAALILFTFWDNDARPQLLAWMAMVVFAAGRRCSHGCACGSSRGSKPPRVRSAA